MLWGDRALRGPSYNRDALEELTARVPTGN